VLDFYQHQLSEIPASPCGAEATPRPIKARCHTQSLLATEEHERRRRVVLVIDEAHLLSPDQLEAIRLLAGVRLRRLGRKPAHLDAYGSTLRTAPNPHATSVSRVGYRGVDNSLSFRLSQAATRNFRGVLCRTQAQGQPAAIGATALISLCAQLEHYGGEGCWLPSMRWSSVSKPHPRRCAPRWGRFTARPRRASPGSPFGGTLPANGREPKALAL
jgi:hypothetical protein